MAILKAPLLSLGASGQLGKTIVTSTWKGIKTGREYVIPANPRTPGQLAQRALMSASVLLWKLTQTTEALRTAWNLAANANPRPLSGFNEYTSAQVKLRAALGDATYPAQVQPYTGTNYRRLSKLGDKITVINAGSFAVKDGAWEGNDFEVSTYTKTGAEGHSHAITGFPEEGFYRIAAVDDDGNEYWISGILPIPSKP